MAIISKSLLKTFFETGDIPTQANFEDLIDTLGNTSLSEGSINNVAIGMDTPAEAQFSSVNVVGDPINDSLVISQSGSGNSLVIENSSDANSPLIVDKNGNVNIGSTTFYNDRKIFSKQTVTSPIQSEYNTFVQLTVNNQSGSDNKTALFGYASPGTSFNTSSKIIGVGGQSSHNYNRTNTNLIGVNCTTGAASGSSGSINQQTGLNVETFTNLGTATINNIYGVAIANQTNTATNIYSLYSDQASAANKWNIFANGTAKNYFRGSVLIGSSTDDGVNALQVTGSSNFSKSVIIEGVKFGKGSGSLNIAIGNGLVYNTSGTYNLSIGNNTLYLNQSGNNNTAIGHSCLTSSVSGTNNTAIGSSSLYSNISGSENTAVGTASLVYNTTGSYNTALGKATLRSNTSGTKNISIGYESLYNNTTGSENVAIGESTLFSNLTSSFNTAIGTRSLYYNSTGSFLTSIGYMSLYNNVSGTNLVAIGYMSLYNNTSGDTCIAIGNQSLFHNADGFHNIAIGIQSLYSSVSGAYNIAIGDQSLHKSTTGGYNTALGYQTLYNSTTGGYNTASGYQTLYNNTTGVYNTALGYQTLYNNTTGVYNTALGSSALYNNSGSGNTAIGAVSLVANNNGNDNVAIGYLSLGDNVSGNCNIAIGNQSLVTNVSGNYNIAIGNSTLYENSTGSYNVCLGNNIILSGDNNTVLGNLVLPKHFSTSNSLIISANNESRIYSPDSGNIMLGYAVSGANDDTLNKLQVNGSAKASQWNVTAMATAPASASDTGTLGEVRVTSDYIYVCVATNTWKRTALTTW